MKRLLFLAVTPPLPANNGQRMRIWSLLRALAAEGHEIHLLTFAQPQELTAYAEPLAKVCRSVEAVPLTLASWSASGNYIERMRGLFLFTPYGVERFRSDIVANRIAARLGEDFDAVIADSVYTVVNLPDAMQTPLIIDDNNIEHMILRRYVLQERNPIRRAYGWLEWQKLRRWEKTACARSALVIVCSEADRTLMREMCPAVPTIMAPNIIDVDSYRASPPCDNTTVLYLGSMDWFPNRHAVETFVVEVLPELRKMVPGVNFVVAYSPERAPAEDFRDRFAKIPDVQFVETSDVRTEVANAAVFVVPLHIGSGTRFKILEASAMAKPIVSTRVGAEGLEFQNGEEILLEDDPKEFARAVTRLLKDPTLRSKLGVGARRRVEQQYDFAMLRTTVGRALARLDTQGGISQSAGLQKIGLNSPVPLCDSGQGRAL